MESKNWKYSTQSSQSSNRLQILITKSYRAIILPIATDDLVLAKIIENLAYAKIAREWKSRHPNKTRLEIKP